VTFAIRYRIALAARSRAALAPAAAWLFVLAGVYAYKPNEVRGSLGITALVLVPVTAWLAVALSHAEPAPQRELLATGTPVASLVEAAAAVAVLGAILGAIDIAWPIAARSFDRDVTASDVAVAVAAHAGCAAYGAALGTLASARLLTRPAVAFAALATVAIVSVPLFEFAPALSPAAWTADALLNGGEVAGPVVALAVHAAALVALAAVALKRVP
jgi:hypothetical protein